jgi:hypothetical protein
MRTQIYSQNLRRTNQFSTQLLAISCLAFGYAVRAIITRKFA